MPLSKVSTNSLSSGITTTFGAGAVGTPSITTTGDTNTGIFFPAADTIAFSEGGAESMRIDSSGRVGINTTSALGTLDTYIGAGLTTFGDFASSVRVQGGNDTNKYVPLTFGGYGNYAPAAIAYLVTTGTGNTKGALVFGTRDVTTDTRPTERMRIDSSGNLLVGTTSTFSPGGVPTTNGVSTGTAGNWALGIRNTSSDSNPYGLTIQYPNSAPNAVSAQFIFCQDSAGTKFDVRSNGGIGNYSANNVNLSDQREKKNIQLAPNYLDKICQIPVKTFLFNDQTDTDLNLGSIAQDVQAVCPELVTESNWGTEEAPKMRLSIYQTDLQYALMKSIQELKAINDTQAETINALTARVDAQAADIAELKTKVA